MAAYRSLTLLLYEEVTAFAGEARAMPLRLSLHLRQLRHPLQLELEGEPKPEARIRNGQPLLLIPEGKFLLIIQLEMKSPPKPKSNF